MIKNCKECTLSAVDNETGKRVCCNMENERDYAMFVANGYSCSYFSNELPLLDEVEGKELEEILNEC